MAVVRGVIPAGGGAAEPAAAFPTPAAGNWLPTPFPPSYNPPTGEAKPDATGLVTISQLKITAEAGSFKLSKIAAARSELVPSYYSFNNCSIGEKAMTDAEWMNCATPIQMVELIRGKTSERKLRLYAVACCHRISDLIKDARSREAVEIAEKHADGLVSDHYLEEAREKSSDASGAAYRIAQEAAWSIDTWKANAAANAAYSSCGHWQNWLSDSQLFDTPIWAARAMSGPEVENVLSDIPLKKRFEAEQEFQCQLLRDLIGTNSFINVQYDRSLFQGENGTVQELARSIYAERSFLRLPALADALEKMGCTDSELLEHCRNSGPHVRGCWAVDLILGNQ